MLFLRRDQCCAYTDVCPPLGLRGEVLTNSNVAIEPPRTICLAVRMRHRLVDQSARAEIRLQNQRRLIVKYNDFTMAGEFRVQGQGRAPRPAANNNEYQGGEQGPGSLAETPCLCAGAQILIAPRDVGANKSPARSPARAHQLSFNFANSMICRVVSTPECRIIARCQFIHIAMS
jgi:hypothetical protein